MEKVKFYSNIDVTTSVFLIMGSLTRLENPTVNQSVEDIRENTGANLTVNNVTGILNRLVKQKRAIREGAGTKGNSRTYSLTKLGLADFRRHVNHVAYLTTYGNQALTCPHTAPKDATVLTLVNRQASKAETRGSVQEKTREPSIGY